MGSANSRGRHGQGQAGRSAPIYGNQGGKKHKRGFFRRRPVAAIQPTLPFTIPGSYRPLYGSYSVSPIPAFGPVQAIPYNNYSPSSYMSPQHMMMLPPQRVAPSMPLQPMMMQPQRVAPSIPLQPMMMQPQRVGPSMASPYMIPPSSMGMPMSSPYAQQPQMQPAYNNIGPSAHMPTGMPGRNGFYPPAYQSAPVRLMTDWTGGGKISPGFLGPPI